MSAKRLENIRACVFDAYGTLFDHASAVGGCRDVLGGELEKLSALWREKQLQYTWLRTLQGRYVDFARVTSDALDYSLDALGISDAPLRDRLMGLYLALDPFPEVQGVLERLKAAGLRTAILSNGTRTMLEATLNHAGLAHLIDDVLSVDDVGVYKTHPRAYGLAADRLGVEPREIAFQSANAWDAYAASAFGMRVIWCNRYHQPAERLPGAPDFEVESLADLPAILSLR